MPCVHHSATVCKWMTLIDKCSIELSAPSEGRKQKNSQLTHIVCFTSMTGEVAFTNLHKITKFPHNFDDLLSRLPESFVLLFHTSNVTRPASCLYVCWTFRADTAIGLSLWYHNLCIFTTNSQSKMQKIFSNPASSSESIGFKSRTTYRQSSCFSFSSPPVKCC